MTAEGSGTDIGARRAMVCIETRASSIHVEETDEVQQFMSLYEHLSSAALNVRDSIRMIEKIAEAIEHKESTDE